MADTVAMSIPPTELITNTASLNTTTSTFNDGMNNHTKVPLDFVGSASTTIEIKQPVVYIMHKSINNHYHWIAEGLGRYWSSFNLCMGSY